MAGVFISHSHVDKAIARRVARRLHAYGIDVWLDEQQLRLGANLSPTIQAQLRETSTVVVIATEAAMKSAWVAKEVDFARGLDPALAICPLFVEHVETSPVVAEHLGLDATDPHRFEESVLHLAEAILDGPLPPPSAERLRAGLEAVAGDEPGLAPLIQGCLDGQGLANASVESVMEVPFHSLDFALNTLYDLAETGLHRYLRAACAATAFRRTGAGAYTLSRYIEANDGFDPIVSGTILPNAVGRKLNLAQIDAALRLLAQTNPRDDQALESFIFENGNALDPSQRTHAIRLVTHPVRGPGDFTVGAAFQALRMWADSDDVKQLWERWIRDGEFDGLAEGSRGPRPLAYHLAEAARLGLDGWDWIVTTHLSHVRSLARSNDRGKVFAAVDHVVAAANEDSPLVEQTAAACESAPGSFEWDDWADAAEMGIYLSAHTRAARTDRDWLRAIKEFRRYWTAHQRADERRAEILSKSDDGDAGG